jgi:hypothetical protein
LPVIRTRRHALQIAVKNAIRPLDLYSVMARNFYFGADATMVAGSASFSALINADAEAFGLTEEQAEAFSQINAELQNAFRAVKEPSTRSPVAVARKNILIKAMQRSAKNLSAIVRAKPGITDPQLISLGLLPRTRRTRRNAPGAPPAVRVLSVRERVVKIRVCDRDSGSGRSKPFAATGSLIFSYVGEQPPTDPSEYRYECFAPRTTTRITFPSGVRSGATIWLSARWVTARAEMSVASAPICFNLQGGAVGAVSAANPIGLRAAA